MSARSNLKFAAVIGLSVFAVSGAAQAAGFYIQEQSAAGVGRAQAGNVAAADDASTIYFNPAGMTQLPGLQMDSGISLLVPSASLRDTGSFDHSPFTGNSLPGGGNGGNPGSATPVPDFYVSAQLPTDLPVWVGIGITAPFGFAAKYEQNSFARYDSIDSFVETIDIAPTIAVKLNDWLSIGLGLDEQYAFVKLRSAVPDAFAAGGPSIASDGRLTLTGHTWSTGFNGGLLITPSPDLKIGLTYRYGITHNIDHGSLTLANLGGLLSAANQQVAGQAALNLPDMMQAGFSKKLTPQLTVLGEFDYTFWSNFKAIDIHTASPSLGDLVTNENYRDTFGISIGAEYQLNDQWRLRSGFKYDETPTVDAFRDTRVPDGNRFEIAAGFHYDYDEHIGLDASYAHLFFQDSNINIQRQFFTTVPAIITTANINAVTSVSVDILAVGLSYKF